MRDWDGIYKARGEVQIQVLPRIKRIASFFKQKKVKTILDLGCGTGRHTMYLAHQGFDVTGIDISETALAITSNKLRDANIRSVKLVRHDMESLPFPDGHFDAVVCMGVLTHGFYVKIHKTISEIHRVIKSKGFLIADVLSTKDPDYGKGTEIEPNTYLGLGEEEDTPHHYYTKKDVLNTFSAFRQLRARHMTRKVAYKKRKNHVANWDIFATKT